VTADTLLRYPIARLSSIAVTHTSFQTSACRMGPAALGGAYSVCHSRKRVSLALRLGQRTYLEEHFLNPTRFLVESLVNVGDLLELEPVRHDV